MDKRRIICILMFSAIALCSCSRTKKTSAEETDHSKETTAVTATAVTSAVESSEETSGAVTGANHPSGFILSDVEDRTVAAEDFISSEKWIRIQGDDLILGDRTPSSLIEAAQTYPEFAEGDSSQNVTKDIYLPVQADDINISWASSDESVISCDGKVTLPHEHSKYVLLTATYETDGKEVEAAYVVRVARDMFAGIGTDKVLPLYGYDELWAFESIGIDPSDGWDYPGWFYEYDELEQLYFFQDNVDDLTIYDKSSSTIADYFITGQLCETSIETAHESDLLLFSMRKIIGWHDNCEMRYEGMMVDGYTDIYDYRQYYNGIPTSGWAKVIIGTYVDIKNVHSWILQIPEGFDSKPSVTEDEITDQYDLVYPSLEIMELDGRILLVWKCYSSESSERVIIDAHTGEEVYRGSTVVT